MSTLRNHGGHGRAVLTPPGVVLETRAFGPDVHIGVPRPGQSSCTLLMTEVITHALAGTSLRSRPEADRRRHALEGAVGPAGLVDPHARGQVGHLALADLAGAPWPHQLPTDLDPATALLGA